MVALDIDSSPMPGTPQNHEIPGDRITDNGDVITTGTGIVTISEIGIVFPGFGIMRERNPRLDAFHTVDHLVDSLLENFIGHRYTSIIPGSSQDHSEQKCLRYQNQGDHRKKINKLFLHMMSGLAPPSEKLPFDICVLPVLLHRIASLY